MAGGETTRIDQRTRHKGRGSLSNRGNRYQPTQVTWDDGICGPSPVTECREVQAGSIIARNSSPDIPFEQSINPYQGCEHGCVYCYARPTHAYLDLSPGLDFETRLTCKINAAERLEQALARPGYQCSTITLGANTDPYQPMESRYRITRQLLEVLLRHRHPVAIITRGALVTRDIDLLAELAADKLCSVAISVTTLDNDLKRRMEPRAPSAAARLEAMARLNDAGIPVSLLFAPVIPALNDGDLEAILARGQEAGAQSAGYILLRLPLEIAELFQEWLREHYPMRAEHVMSLLRQSRGGQVYDRRFGHRMKGTGPFAELLAQRFRVACLQLGLSQGESTSLRTDLFLRPTARNTPEAQQFDLF